MSSIYRVFPGVVAAGLLVISPPFAMATVSRYADFPMGEAGSLGTNNRPQDVSGNFRNFTADSNGGASVVATAGVAAPGSTACLDLSASADQWWTGGPNLAGITDNFAFGVYARAAGNTSGHQGDIFCTSASGNGTFKVSLDATGWNASAHNIAYIGTRASNFTPNVWVHLALIRSGGQTTFYVNGVAQGAGYGPAPVVGSMTLGGFGGSVFDGQIDEARVVTFTAGETVANILDELQTSATPSDTSPVLTSEPPDLTVRGGETVILAAPATGAMPMTWRWFRGTTLVSESATSASLTLAGVTIADSGSYHAEVSNIHGTASTRTLALTVLPPLITLAPSTTPNAGQQAMINRKYGMFCHFGINTFRNEQWTDGTVPPSAYTPGAVEVEQWVRTAYLSGMTYILIIAKHHDGFCMWPSAHTTYDVASSPNPTDVMQLAAAACRKYGIKLAVYYSLWDRNWDNGAMRATSVDLTPAQSTAYVAYMKNQLTELLTNYGPVCELWLDGSWITPADDWHLPEVYDHVKQLQPDCQFASNITIGTAPESQTAGQNIQYFPSDFRLHDPMLPRFPDPKTFSHEGSTYYLPFEATITLSTQNFWFYDTRENAAKSITTLENWWNTCTAQNNLLVLNAAPDRNGVLLPWDIATLGALANRLGLEPGGVFPANLATTATATASSVFNGDNTGYGPSLATDENPNSRWAAAAGTTNGWLELDFGTPTTFTRVIANEYLTRIQSFNLQSWDGSAWQTITTGTSLGESARIDFPAVTTTRLRLNILAASDSPSLWMLKVQAGGAAPPPPDHDGVWIAPSGGVWQVTGLWEAGSIASGVDHTARFDTLDLTSHAVVTVQSPLPIGGMRFGDTIPTHDWTVEAVNHHSLTLSAAAGFPVITVVNRSATLAASLAGTAGLRKDGTGELVLSAANTFTGISEVSEGSLLVDGSTAAGTSIHVSPGATLGGAGTIHGPVTLDSGSILAPGHGGSGVLTIDSTLVLPSGGTLMMEINKSGATLTSDRLSGLAGITYGGTLTVAAGGDILASGDRFTLFSLAGGGYAGAFGTLNLPPLAAGLKWDTSGLTTDGVIRVTDIGAAGPVFSQLAGYYYGEQSITLSCATPGAVIHYTTDGSVPTATSPVYSAAIVVPVESVLAVHAIAISAGLENSPVVSATYTTGTSSLTIQAWYHLGEAASLGTNNRPLDSSGNARHFGSNQNVPGLSTEDAGGPLGRSGFTSTASILSGNGQINGFWNNNYSLPANDSGMEIWVKTSAAYTDGWIFASGSASSHLVIAVNGGRYRASTNGGASWFDDNSAVVSTTDWTHLALVRDGGVSTFYVNGTPHGNSSASVTAGNATHLVVTSGGNSGFKGYIDEARMFTFASGTFQPTDLLYRANRAPAFETNPLVLNASAGVAFAGLARAGDPDANDTVIHNKFEGPSWLTVSPTGELGGTPGPADCGANDFVIRATDAFGASATLVLRINVSATDTNGNGILDDWESAMFGNIDSGANLPLDDADGDGLCNLLEYGLGTHPMQHNASPLVCELAPVLGENHLRVTVFKNPLATNLSWAVEMSDTLEPGSWSVDPTLIEEETLATLKVRSLAPVSGVSRRFARVRVSVVP